MKLVKFSSNDPNWKPTECKSCGRLTEWFVVNDDENIYRCYYCGFHVNVCICDYCGEIVDRMCHDGNGIWQCKKCNERLFKEGKTTLRMT